MDPEQFEDPELKGLARALPGVLVYDRAPKTVTTYLAAFTSPGNVGHKPITCVH